MKRSFATLIGAATLASIPVAAPPAAKAGARDILAAINLERESAGIAPVTLREDWTSACAQHAQYMATNNVLTHLESAGTQLFSSEGSWAGEHAVLARNTAGFAADPWTNAPFHEFQALHPWLRETGIGVAGDYACMVTLSTRDAPDSDEIKLITSPGFGQFHRPAEVAQESPFVPGDEVGLPAGTKTGPHIYVYAVGPERYGKVVVEGAMLSASDGGEAPVLAWVDGNSPRSSSYLDGGAILIPTTPLRDGITYGLRVQASTTTAEGQKLLISRSTSFIAGPDESDLAPVNQTNDTVSAASAGPQASTGRPVLRSRTANVVLGSDAAPKINVTIRWTKHGLRTRILCNSTTVACTGPLRMLVVRRGHRVQKLRFVARPGALHLRLAPGHAIIRRLTLTRRQIHSGQVRGFAVRWGGGAPVKVASPRR